MHRRSLVGDDLSRFGFQIRYYLICLKIPSSRVITNLPEGLMPSTNVSAPPCIRNCIPVRRHAGGLFSFRLAARNSDAHMCATTRGMHQPRAVISIQVEAWLPVVQHYFDQHYFDQHHSDQHYSPKNCRIGSSRSRAAQRLYLRDNIACWPVGQCVENNE